MNPPDELLAIWNSTHNRLPAAQQTLFVEKFTRRMVRRRRFQKIWLANTFLWLAAITMLAIRNVVVGRTNLAHEWSLLPLLLAPWAAAIFFVRLSLRSRTMKSEGNEPLVVSLREELKSNRIDATQLKWIGALYIVLIPLLVLSMCQLQQVGKMSAHDLTSMTIVFTGILLVCGSGVAWRYFRHLAPQRTHLEELLRHWNGC